MKALRRMWSRIAGTFTGRNRDAELANEFESHIVMLSEKNLRRGMSPEEARRAAILTFGGVEPAKESYRDQRGLPPFDSLQQDVRFGLRMLRKSPGFTAVVVACLALGIGANTAMFTVINAVLLRPLPFKDSARLVSIYATPDSRYPDRISDTTVGAFQQIKAQVVQFSDVSALQRNFVNMTGAAEPEWLDTWCVPSAFFSMLGIQAVRGRTFLPEEQQPGHNLVAVLSYELWQRQFGGDDSALGKTVYFDEEPFVIVGIMPKSFDFPREALAWTPLNIDGIPRNDPRRKYVSVVAKLGAGVSVQEAQSVLAAIASRISQNEPRMPKTYGFVIRSIAEWRVKWIRNALWLLFGAVGFVLLIACTNVGNLFLARGWNRRKEFAVRVAMGATRFRIVRQLLVESVIVALLGGAFGLVFAIGCVGVLRSIMPPEIPRIDQLGVDKSVFLFTLVISVVSGILFGLIPASQIFRPELNDGLKGERSPGVNDWSQSRALRIRNVLTTFEVASCLILLIGSTLAIRTFSNLLDVNPGFRTDHILTMLVALPKKGYPQRGQSVAAILRMAEELRAVPGVEAASAKVDPFMGGFDLGDDFTIQTAAGREAAPGLQTRYITSKFFETLRVALIQGRIFDNRDDVSAEPIAIVNESLAKRYFPGGSPLGEHLVEQGMGGKPGTALEIIGEVADTRDTDISVAPQPTVYMPFAQSPFPIDMAFFLVRTAVDPSGLRKALEQRLWSIDKDVPIQEIQTVDQAISESRAEPKFRAMLLSTFSFLGLALALVGIYGVVAYSVGQRTREIGIRIALGAQRGNVMLLVMKAGMLPVLVGIAVGAAGALMLTRLIQSFLYEIKPTDPVSFVAASAALCTIALLACYQPARRATQVDPIVALRHE